jgi:glycosyltransferase involved in cell wall biosynthesis
VTEPEVVTLPFSTRILIIATGLNRGGAEMQVFHLAKGLRARGWEAEIVSMLCGGIMGDQFREAGIPLHELGMRRSIPDPRAIFRLRKIIRNFRPDVVHSHMVHANLLARLTRVVCPMPVLIATAHSMAEGRRWTELAYRITDPLADLTTIICEAAAARYIRVGAVPERKLQTLPNGVQLEDFRPNAENRATLRAELGVGHQFVWLAVGRLDTPKDYPNLLTAMARLRSEHHVLLIAGDGPLRQSIERLAAELGISEKVRLLGMRKDIPQLMAAADAYVMSSAWEGLPMVLLEAAASALPIVTTAVGGNNEVVHDEVNGFLVPASNSEALAGAMQRMEHLPAESRLSMGLAGRDHVAKHYSLSSVVDQWETIYRSLLQRKYAHIPHAQAASRA